MGGQRTPGKIIADDPSTLHHELDSLKFGDV